MKPGTVGILACATACWTGSAPPATTLRDDVSPVPVLDATNERRAVLRLDARAGGKRFQGVWLEFRDGTKWVVDYRPRDVWTFFADTEVIVTGTCYEPQGQAILAPHFRVDSLRPVEPVRGLRPYAAVGPEIELRGELVTTTAPPGSKLAGSTSTELVADSGERFHIVGAPPRLSGRVDVRGRVLEPDMSHHARTRGPDLWVAAFDAAPREDEPRTVECPGT